MKVICYSDSRGARPSAGNRLTRMVEPPRLILWERFRTASVEATSSMQEA